MCQGHSQDIASHLSGFRHAGSHVVSLLREGGMPLSHHGPPVSSSDYPKYLSSIVLQQESNQIVTVLVTQIRVLGPLGILRECT